MRGKCYGLVALVTALAMASSASARPDAEAIVLREGRLAQVLKELAVKRRVGILYSPETVSGQLSPRVAGRLSVEQVLSRLLAGSGLAYRRAAEGAFIIYRPETTEPPPVVAEILIVGRKLQNADIQRTESDIQPYQVLSSRDLAGFRADQVGQLVRDRFTFDSHGGTADPLGSRSSFNIHGLSIDETLVLIDGMRMPGVPQSSEVRRTGQPDLNAIPLMAIERIEALTATSGGIYGPGATGGVVNVVLARDYRGVEISTGLGLTGRGDALTRRLDARLGFTPDHGRTDVMLVVSRATSEGLRVGDRDYDRKSRLVQLETGALPYAPESPLSEGVRITGYGGANLVLKSSLGGRDLGATSVLLPLGYADLLASGGAGLTKALAGDDALVAANPHDRTTIRPAYKTASAIASARHDFGGGVEGFVDLVYLQNNSTQYAPGFVAAAIDADDPANVFRQPVQVTFPLPGFGSTSEKRLSSYRLTSGVIASLSGDWRGEVSASWGGVRAVNQTSNVVASPYLPYAMNYFLRRFALPANFANPIPNIFGDWSKFVADAQTYKIHTSERNVLHQSYQNVSLRLGGPLVRTEAGPVSLTVTGEWRREAVGSPERVETRPDFKAQTFFPPYIQAVASGHGELRAPLVSRDSPWVGLRGLELQLAGRYDRYMAKLPNALQSSDLQSAHRGTFTTVAGFRVTPWEPLMVRASVATGTLPPAPEWLTPSTSEEPLIYVLPSGDPRRGGERSNKSALIWLTGSPNVKPERARTVSFGVVLNPAGGERPRVSLDYIRIDKRGELNMAFSGAFDYFIQNEDRFPERVKRAPLTAEDIAAGYTGGVITEIDASPINGGRARIEAVDLKVDYRRPVGSSAMLRLYSTATWSRQFVRAEGLEGEALSYLNSRNGPLTWRANGGADLDYGAWTIGLNGQFYGPYDDVTPLGILAGGERTAVRRVGAQFYLDLNAAYRLERPADARVRSLEFKFGIANLLDAAGPSLLEDYSPFSDPRGRRFDASISAKF